MINRLPTRDEIENEKKRRRILADCAEFIRECVWIEDKLTPTKVGRFVLWSAQVAALAIFMVERWVIALKARQLGFTWLALSYAVWRMIKTPGYTVVAISKTEDDAIELVDFRLARIMLPRLPTWLIQKKAEAAPGWTGPVWEANKHELVIHHPGTEENPGGSVSRFKADAGASAGASLTVDLVILDEWGLNTVAPAIWQSAFPTLNRPGDGPEAGQVFIISTNRRASLFEEQVMEARKGVNGMHLIFWPWMTDPRRTPEWYEDTKRKMPDTYMREYPATIDEALSAGDDTALPEFDSREGGVHVVRPFPIPHWWRRWRGNDPGFSDAYAWYWLAADEDGTVYIYREFARDPKTDPKLNYSEQAKRVAELSFVGTEVPGRPPDMWPNPQTGEQEPRPENIQYTVTGMDAFNKHPNTGKGHVDYYQEGGLTGFVEPVHGPGARAAMLTTWHEYLRVFDGPDGTPTARLKIFSTCRLLIETLPKLVKDPRDQEKVAELPFDHYYQGAGYALQSWHPEESKEPDRPQSPLQAHKEKLARQLKRRGYQ